MRDAALLRDPIDPDQQATNLLRSPMPSRWHPVPTLKQLRQNQTAGVEGVLLPLALTLPFSSGHI